MKTPEQKPADDAKANNDDVKAAEEKEAARVAAEQAKIDPDANKEVALSPAAKAKQEHFMKANKDKLDVPVAETNNAAPQTGTLKGRDSGDENRPQPNAHEFESISRQKSRLAAEKLRRIALDYQRSTPDEFVIFGRGGIKYTLGDLRDLTNTR